MAVSTEAHGAAHPVLRSLQLLLERLYQVEAGADVTDFVLTDESFVRLIEGQGFRPADEKLLVQEIDDELNVSLYLAPELLDRLSGNPPHKLLADDNLVDFWTALEGISHFVYLGHNARHERPVSRLEMELQAEVDKFVAAALLVARQTEGRVPGTGLHHALFGNPDFAPDLDAEERYRYQTASLYAGRYCERLLERMHRPGTGPLHRELRRFYRLPQTRKLDFIEAGLA